jgi:hypothetical protein
MVAPEQLEEQESDNGPSRKQEMGKNLFLKSTQDPDYPQIILDRHCIRKKPLWGLLIEEKSKKKRERERR